MPTPPSAHDLAVQAKAASRTLAATTTAQRNAALAAIAAALEAARTAILTANAADLADADATLPAATRARLALDDRKLTEMIEQVRAVAALPDPLGRTLDAIELDHALHLQKISIPLGVLAVIFEARPDAVTQIASLALKSGNAALLKPGSEVERTAAALIAAIHAGLASTTVPTAAVTLVTGRDQTAELLREHTLVDLVIPRGSRALVEYVQANTRIPVLGHAEGVCHLYIDAAADIAQALRLAVDAKCDYPAACNAVETILVHRELAAEFLPRVAETLRGHGVTLHGDAEVRALLPGFPIAPVADWHYEYGALGVSLRVVNSLRDAIDHIHAHGSSHTETIVTEDPAAAETFLREVDAAGVFHNASTRFADGFRYGFGAEVGVSTSKFHARGPVGLDGLTTYKYILRGAGHTAAEYRGPEARAFTHRRSSGGQP